MLKYSRISKIRNEIEFSTAGQYEYKVNRVPFQKRIQRLENYY